MEPGTIAALSEAFTAFHQLVGDDFRDEFILIGSYALQAHGIRRVTRDIDFAVTPQALAHFHTVASQDPRFIYYRGAEIITYYCSGSAIEDLAVNFDFVNCQLFGIELQASSFKGVDSEQAEWRLYKNSLSSRQWLYGKGQSRTTSSMNLIQSLYIFSSDLKGSSTCRFRNIFGA